MLKREGDADVGALRDTLELRSADEMDMLLP